MKNKPLATLIRKGLSTPNITEDPDAFGVEFRHGRPFANVIGLAYLGTGKDPAYAADMFKVARQEMPTGQSPTVDSIDKELGEIGILTPVLANLNHVATASDLADKLEKGTFQATD